MPELLVQQKEKTRVIRVIRAKKQSKSQRQTWPPPY